MSPKFKDIVKINRGYNQPNVSEILAQQKKKKKSNKLTCNNNYGLLVFINILKSQKLSLKSLQTF